MTETPEVAPGMVRPPAMRDVHRRAQRALMIMYAADERKTFAT